VNKSCAIPLPVLTTTTNGLQFGTNTMQLEPSKLRPHPHEPKYTLVLLNLDWVCGGRNWPYPCMSVYAKSPKWHAGTTHHSPRRGDDRRGVRSCTAPSQSRSDGDRYSVWASHPQPAPTRSSEQTAWRAAYGNWEGRLAHCRATTHQDTITPTTLWSVVRKSTWRRWWPCGLCQSWERVSNNSVPLLAEYQEYYSVRTRLPRMGSACLEL